ncbi:MAG: CpaF family protein, partial [Hydrogenophaga sp.]|nr:CpaF family protein [Hydrogenophaga sp.]
MQNANPTGDRSLNEVARVGNTQRVLAQLMDTLDVLRPYFADGEINEIMINGPDDVFISKHGEDTKVRVK